MAVSKKAKSIYMNFFDGIETSAANFISDYQEKKYLKKHIDRSAKLTKEQKKQIKEFWKPYCKISYKWALYYSAKNGKFDPRYIPNTLYYTIIDQHFNARKLGYGFNDKNYYSLIFNDVRQPEVVVRKIGDIFVDANYSQLSVEEAIKILTENEYLICKPSQESGSGRGIEFWDPLIDGERIKTFLFDNDNRNYLIQKIVKQSPEMDKIHKGSLNTIRVCSLLMEDGVHVLSAVVRMGMGNSKIDNATAKDNAKYDGMTCGVNHDGTLKEFAFGYYTGKKYSAHPDGLVFKDFKIPSYEKIKTLIKQIHPRIANFRLVSWDFALDVNNEPVLIEANMRKGAINFHQFNNGPLFGDLTERVLNEVFCKK